MILPPWKVILWSNPPPFWNFLSSTSAARGSKKIEMSTSPEHYKQTTETIYFSLWKTHFSSAAQHSYWDPASAKKTKHRETWLIMVKGLSGVLTQFVIKRAINKIRWPSRGSPICLNEVKWNIYLTQLTTRSVRVVSEQSFGSSAVSLACITSICSVQPFPGSHSLHLAFGSFFYCLILAVFCCSVKPFSFFVIFGYAWLYAIVVSS